LNEVFDCLNVLGGGNDKVVQETFSRQHRTLQQSFVKVVVLPILAQLAEAHETGRVDMRNQAAAALAAKFLAAVKEDELYLPLI